QGMVPYASYIENDEGIFPKGWHKGTMSGEEMFEELLGFEITPEPM
ncbi:RES domain-containing protein, partial [Escherichia coli]|nr:RES domain-containing protein [Escherichia coli]